MTNQSTSLINKALSFTTGLTLLITFLIENAHAEKIPVIKLDGKPLHLITSSYPDFSDTWSDDLENKVWRSLSLRVSSAMGSVFYDQGIQIHTASYGDKNIPSKAREALHFSKLLSLRDKHDAYGIVILRTEKIDQPRVARFVAELKLVKTTLSKPSETDLKNATAINELVKRELLLERELIQLDPDKESKSRSIASEPIFRAEADVTFQDALNIEIADVISQSFFERLFKFLDENHTVNRTTLN